MPTHAPEPLERVRDFALPGDVAEAWGMRLRHSGEMRLNLNRPWRSFRAQEQIDARRLEFRWDARLRLAPLARAEVREAFQRGHGRVEARLLGVNVQRSAGAEIDVTELTRLLSELVWCPMALYHADLDFDAPDSHTLRVGVNRDGVLAGVTMRLDEAGRIVQVRAAGRPRLIGKATLATDWLGNFGDYRDFGGVRMPARGEQSWALPDGAFHYLRTEILEAELLGTPEA
ncbi:MAG: hypothetical protein J2P45_31015 [Candidatus Dormibacteraeota bacterium]|nr:hypothetical protein [Candidatus Dormibacteraeota bacterium]